MAPEMTVLIALSLVAPSAFADRAAPGPGEKLAATCAGCHGTQGHALPGMPALRGQSAADIVQAMAEFRSGARKGTVMPQIARGYTEAQVRSLAETFAARAERP